MVSSKLILSLAAAVSGALALVADDDFALRLIARQAPGTPEYNCHDNCGQAIRQARVSTSVCKDEIFLADYKACLQCAGPDNSNIWSFYGNSLTPAAQGCGLSTTPLAGKQADVGPAVPAGAATTASSTKSSTTAAPPASTAAPSTALTTTASGGSSVSAATQTQTTARTTTASASPTTSFVSVSSANMRFGGFDFLAVSFGLVLALAAGIA